MLLSKVFGAFLAIAPALAAAAGGQLGFSLGATNPDGSNKTTSDYVSDLNAIKQYTDSRLVRIYAASQADSAANLMPAAKQTGFKVILGIWVINADANDTSFAADSQAIYNIPSDLADSVYAVTVGSEGVYRGNYTAAKLLNLIQEFRQNDPNKISLVGTADTWNMYTQGQMDPLITSGTVNILLANAFAYWQNGGENINNATYTYFTDLAATTTYVQNKVGSLDAIEVWTGETGWPTDGGSNYGPSIAGTANAKQFWDDGVCAMLGWGGNVFYFEAFDEPGKPPSIGQDGTSAIETVWGAMTAERTPKFNLQCGGGLTQQS